jgi:four helix bundle protein
MSVAKDFRDLIIWQRAHVLALEVYRVTDGFPNVEQFGLTNQLRRAAVSVPSNIAEGFERNSAKDFSHFLVISRGSLSEIKAQLLLAKDLLYLPPQECEQLCSEATEIHKMLNSFKATLEKKGLVH